MKRVPREQMIAIRDEFLSLKHLSALPAIQRKGSICHLSPSMVRLLATYILSPLLDEPMNYNDMMQAKFVMRTLNDYKRYYRPKVLPMILPPIDVAGFLSGLEQWFDD